MSDNRESVELLFLLCVAVPKMPHRQGTTVQRYPPVTVQADSIMSMFAPVQLINYGIISYPCGTVHQPVFLKKRQNPVNGGKRIGVLSGLLAGQQIDLLGRKRLPGL